MRVRLYLAEFIGTGVLVLVGLSVVIARKIDSATGLRPFTPFASRQALSFRF